MRRLVLPSRASLAALALLAGAALLARLLGLPPGTTAAAAGTVLAGLLVLAAVDLWRSLALWRADALQVQRRLPAAFAIGVPTELTLDIVNPGPRTWQLQVFDDLDPVFDFTGLPRALTCGAQTSQSLSFQVAARQRGVVRLGRTQLLWRTRAGVFQVRESAGEAQSLRVYPNFAALARYAWLSGDRRLAQIGQHQSRGRFSMKWPRNR